MADKYIEWLANLDWQIVVIMCLTLGLAPFAPPHIVEKISMLINGTLRRPIDWFDLFFHGIPWLLLLSKVIVSLKK